MRKTIILTILLSIFAALPLSASDMPSSSPKKKFSVQYMGNIETGHLFLWDGFMKNSSGAVTLSTTHGVRFTPYLFVGGGAGFWLIYYSGGASGKIPLFGDVRLTLPNQKLRPFFDLKGGWLDSNTNFVGPSIGCKYAWGRKGGVYLSFGTNLLITHYDYGGNTGWDGFHMRIGFDF